jgi:hypothetical protein
MEDIIVYPPPSRSLVSGVYIYLAKIPYQELTKVETQEKILKEKQEQFNEEARALEA